MALGQARLDGKRVCNINVYISVAPLSPDFSEGGGSTSRRPIAVWADTCPNSGGTLSSFSYAP
jgi:hypothetical protein